MKMSMSGMEGLEFEGVIHRCKVEQSHLVIQLRLDNPTGWTASAAMSRKDVLAFAWILLRSPAALAYLLFGRQPR